MKFKWLKLTGYGGMYQGMLQKEIYFDFTKAKGNMIYILGDNGSGKSTLMRAISMYPDSNESFLPIHAEKSGCVIDGTNEYEFHFEHPVRIYTDNNGEEVIERKTTRAFIKKKDSNGWTELNPSGTVGSYKDIMETEFKLDPNFMALSMLSTEDKGLVGKTPAERKRFFNTIIDQVVAYNNINKVLTKRNSVNKSMANNLIHKIDSIGDEEIVKSTLESLERRINGIELKKEEYIGIIAEMNSLIKIIDPDLSIQNLYRSIDVELESVENDLRRYNSNLEYIFRENNISSLNMENALKMYTSSNEKLNKIKSDISNAENNIETYLRQREDEYGSIRLKTQRLESLKSELDYMDIENSIRIYSEAINRYEKIFEDIHIKDAISISKDEYVTGLNTLRDIKDMVEAFQTFRYTHTIENSVQFIVSNVDVLRKRDDLEGLIEVYERKSEELGATYITFQGYHERIQALTNRAKGCKIDTCAFISDSVQLVKQYPNIEADIASLSKEKHDIDADIRRMKEEVKELDECLLAIKDIKVIMRNIDNNKSILKKLPNGDIFLDTHLFLNKIKNHDEFREINDLYQYINYANIFEEYGSAKTALYKLEADKTIFDSKNSVIEELDKDISELQLKLDNISDTISNQNTVILSLKNQVIDLEILIKNLDVVISTHNKIKDTTLLRDEYIGKLDTISDNMIKINDCLKKKEEVGYLMKEAASMLAPMIQDRDKMKFGLEMLSQYNSELAIINASYNKIEVIKRFSNPSKEGIQNLFIQVYMNQTLKLANEILSLFFEGRMVLTKFNIGESEFSIPCYSSFSNMETDDISTCSRSEKAMGTLAISAALMNQASTSYNVFKIDELDEGLDASNRLGFDASINKLTDMLNIEQCFIISHSSELNIANSDIIKLRTSGENVIGEMGNVIFDHAML